MSLFTKEEMRRYVDQDVEAVAATMRKGSLSVVFGRNTLRFETEFASAMGVPFAVATNSGTAALEMALDLLDIGFEDEVIVPAYSFAATALAVLRNLAVPRFADISPSSWNLTPESVEVKLTERTRAVIAVHTYGNPCDVVALRRLCDQQGLALIEDCAQAAGATIEGQRVGSFATIGCFSFNEIKNLTTGEGGMLTLRNRAAAEQARLLRLYGTREGIGVELGFKCTMTEMEASLGRSQLGRLDAENESRTVFGTALSKILGDQPGLSVQQVDERARHVYSRYAFCVDAEVTNTTREALEARLAEDGLAVHPIYPVPLPRHPFVEALAQGTVTRGFAKSFRRAYGRRNPLAEEVEQPVPNAEEFCATQTGFSVPPGASERHADILGSAVIGALEEGQRR